MSRLSQEDWGDPIGITWNTSNVIAKDGLLAISFQLGGSHAQPDWDATTAFKWDGSRFMRAGFEAHGIPGGSHPNEVMRNGVDLSALQLQEQSNTSSNSGTDIRETTSPTGPANVPGSEGSNQSSSTAPTVQTSPTAQAPSASQAATAHQRLATAQTEFEHNQYDMALQDCSAALQIDPHDPQALQLKGKIENMMRITVQQWLTLAQTEFEHNRYDIALQDCSAALQIDPRNSEAFELRTKIEATMKVLNGRE